LLLSVLQIDTPMQSRPAFLVAGAGALLLVIALFAMRAPLTGSHADHASEEPELAVLMAQMQYFTHKLGLSVEHRNIELAAFYHHELEEVTEEVIDHVQTYDGYPVADLTRAMLLPLIEVMEESITRRDWANIDGDLARLIDTCNACHAATDHAFIRIEPRFDINPFLQDFRPQ
jgi:hypothetical protein